jgi:hypothetical protein
MGAGDGRLQAYLSLAGGMESGGEGATRGDPLRVASEPSRSSTVRMTVEYRHRRNAFNGSSARSALELLAFDRSLDAFVLAPDRR